jgi:hypothetical protein
VLLFERISTDLHIGKWFVRLAKRSLVHLDKGLIVFRCIFPDHATQKSARTGEEAHHRQSWHQFEGRHRRNTERGQVDVLQRAHQKLGPGGKLSLLHDRPQ